MDKTYSLYDQWLTEETAARNKRVKEAHLLSKINRLYSVQENIQQSSKTEECMAKNTLGEIG